MLLHSTAAAAVPHLVAGLGCGGPRQTTSCRQQQRVVLYKSCIENEEYEVRRPDGPLVGHRPTDEPDFCWHDTCSGPKAGPGVVLHGKGCPRHLIFLCNKGKMKFVYEM